MNVYALWDRKVREYGQLQLASNDEAVIRALRDGIPKGSIVEKYPDDFDLMRVGRFDAESGTLDGEEKGFVVNLAALVELRPPVAGLGVESFALTEKGEKARKVGA